MKLKINAPNRNFMEVGPGDYIKVYGQWKKIFENKYYQPQVTPQTIRPKTWELTAEDKVVYIMFVIERYAKKEDFEDE